MTLAEIRKEYSLAGLRRLDLEPDPIAQFNRWFEQAFSAGVLEPNAMSLATVDDDGQPSCRTVLLKGVSPLGFSFFTNYQSRKGRELELNPRAALNFFWPGLERQVSVRGVVEKTAREESEAYFQSRPLGSRYGAWVSRQSAVVENREFLEQRLAEVTAQFGENVPCPEYWGGYRLQPVTIEFWQGRPNRLHDRFLYTRSPSGWSIDRLSP